MENDKVKAYVNLAARKAYEYNNGAAKEVPMPSGGVIDDMMAILSEAVASADDELMEKFFEGEEFTREELSAA
jgi:elongation factor G